MTEFKVHRIRFVEFQPEAIHCLAFKDDKSRLAVSRQDGTIEIWNTLHLLTWTKDFVIASQTGRSIESLIWCGNRLFSAGLGGDITEWDLERLIEKQTVDSNGGAVWSLAPSHKGDLLAAGCEDGAVRLFDIESGNLEPSRVLDKQEFRILCLAWSHCGGIIVTGSTDSTIQVYDLKSKRIISRISTDKLKQKNTLVWSIYLTRDMTIISGDSMGQTQFWDANSGTLLTKFKIHEADVLALCINENEDTVYSSGVDSRIAEFKLCKQNDGYYSEWNLTRKVTVVYHDIRALAVCDDYIVAGGVDPRLVRLERRNFQPTVSSLLSPFLLSPSCCVAAKGNLLVFPERNVLHVWKLPCLKDKRTQDVIPKKLLELKSCRTNHITACDVSSDGSVIAFADVKGLSVFRVTCSSSDSGIPNLEVSKVKLNHDSLSGILKVKVSSDGANIFLANTHGIGIVDLTSEDQSVRFPFNILHKSIKLPWMLFTVNKDATFIAAVDASFTTYICNVVKNKCFAKRPHTDHRPTAIGFQPGTNNLVQVFSDKTLQIFNVETEKLDPWAANLNEWHLLKKIPTRASLFFNIIFNPEKPREMFLQSVVGFVKVNIGSDINKIMNQEVEKKKRVELKSKIVKVCTKYSPLLHLDITDEKSFVIVERPLDHVISTLPPALKRKKFGTC
eukprot:gene18978-20885_t